MKIKEKLSSFFKKNKKNDKITLTYQEVLNIFKLTTNSSGKEKKYNLNKKDIENISFFYNYLKLQGFQDFNKDDKLNTLKRLINKPVENINEQPKQYCKAKCSSNRPSKEYKDCNCHNFCKFDGIQFDTDLA